MLRYALTRGALLIAGLLVASALIFLALRVFPGDVAQLLAGDKATPAQVAEIRRSLGLDQPVLTQYLGWIGGEGRGRALGLNELKFSGQVLPEARKVVYNVDIKRVMRSKLVLGIADGWLSVDDQIIYRAKDLKVGLFKQGVNLG